VKGFRFLLQAITDKPEFENLVLSDDFISILKSFSQREKRFTFDVGIDQRSGGTWQLETFSKVLEKLYDNIPEDKRTVIVMSKTTLSNSIVLAYANWLTLRQQTTCANQSIHQSPLTPFRGGKAAFKPLLLTLKST
jgi:hypothetical protein